MLFRGIGMGARRRPGRRLLVLMLAVAAVVAGCSGDGQTTADAEGEGLISNPRRPVQELLRERAKHLEAGDLEGYLAGLDPPARAFEEPIARRALALAIHKIDMTIGKATISDDGTRFREAGVTLTYSFEELPEDNPFQLHLQYAIERRQDRFVVTESGFHPDGEPPMWALTDVEITRSPHFLVMSSPGTPRVAEAAAQAEEGLARLVPKVPLETDDRYLFVAARDTEQYRAIGGLEGTIATASVDYERAFSDNRVRPLGRFFAADLSSVFRDIDARLPDTSLSLPASVVFQHELAHLALSRFTRPCTVDWVVEGAAGFLSGEDRTKEWEEHIAGDRLESLRLNPVEEESLDYSFAQAAVLHLTERDGTALFFDFYQNFKDLPEPAQGCSGSTVEVRASLDERLLRRHYRLTVEELEDATRASIRRAVGTP